MIWVRDQTGRFPERPHFEPAEIEAECERQVLAFHRDKYRRAFEPPWSTEDLKTMLEQASGDLDLYADLGSREGEDVEGMTTFSPGQSPRVEVDSSLTSEPRRENRLRTTLTHEFTHVVLHGPIWELLWERQAGPNLFPHQPNGHCGRCRRSTMLTARQTDWMEWQAGLGSGSILMPRRLVAGCIWRPKRRASCQQGFSRGRRRKAMQLQ